MAAFIFALILWLTVDVTYGIQQKDILGTHSNRIKITYGSPVNITDHPYMAQYRGFNKTRGCGAAIISEQFLVTAAHCVVFHDTYEDITQPYGVTVGLDKNSLTGGEHYEIETVRVHSHFLGSVLNKIMEYDIAVIKLKENLTLSDRVKPIKMADSDYVLKNDDVLTTIGFGKTETGVSSSTLLGVNLTYVDKTTCQKKYFQEYGLKITLRMICALGTNQTSSCHGDSGGPIVHNGVLVGLTSWGNPFCGSSCQNLVNWPGVYASIPALRSFVDSTIEDLSKNT